MRVIVTSAYTQERAGASLQSTIEHFIRKPYRLDHLLHLIRPNASWATHCETWRRMTGCAVYRTGLKEHDSQTA